MTTEDLECYINLAGKVVSGFKRTDSSFERSPTVGKVPLNSIPCYREITCERKSQLMWQTPLFSC